MKEAKAEVEKTKDAFNECNSLMNVVENIVKSTREAAVIIGVENVYNKLSERLTSAQKEIENQTRDLTTLEDTYLKLKKTIFQEKKIELNNFELNTKPNINKNGNKFMNP